MTKTIFQHKDNNEFQESIHVPLEKITEYMLAGWSPAEEKSLLTEEEDVFSDSEYFEPDIDASNAVDRDIENAVFFAEHTKENVCKAIENIDILNAAISHLGDIQTEDEHIPGEASLQNSSGFSAAFARTGRRLWMWVTGKDPKTMEQKWETKCLSHTRATKAFYRQLQNYENFDSTVDLARYIAAFHWKQLEHILEDGYTGITLPKVDKKKNYTTPNSTAWMPISGAKVLSVKGGGTQILWDSRMIWLPSSQIKKISGSLSIPTWLAKKNNMI